MLAGGSVWGRQLCCEIVFYVVFSTSPSSPIYRSAKGAGPISYRCGGILSWLHFPSAGRSACCTVTCCCYCCRWKAAGLDRLEVAPGSCSVAAEQLEGRAARVHCRFVLSPREAPSDPEGDEAQGAGVGEVRRGLAFYGSQALSFWHDTEALSFLMIASIPCKQ